jgi:predicted permease
MSVVDPQTLLVGAQVSLALILLVGVGLMGSSVRELLSVDEGFHTERLLSFDFSSPRAVPRMDPRNPDVWRDHITLSAQFDDRIQERLTNLPGVQGVTISSGAVLSDFQAVLGVTIEDSELPTAEGTSIGVVPVADNYFDMMGIPVVRGRVFNRSDDLTAPPVVVISEAAVERYFPDRDPIGKRITTWFSLPGRATAEVIGIVGDVIYTGPEEVRWPVAYYPLRERRFHSTAMVRTAGDPRDALRVIQEELFALDPTVAMSNINTVNQLISRSVGDRGLVFWLLLAFATVTVLLAAIGTWGVVAYAVAQRQRELCLRMALGAKGSNVLGLVLRRSIWTAVAGVVFGLSGAWAGSRVLEALLWNTSAHDPRIYLGGGALLFSIVLAASYLPALRATRVDPVEVLKAAE